VRASADLELKPAICLLGTCPARSLRLGALRLLMIT